MARWIDRLTKCPGPYRCCISSDLDREARQPLVPTDVPTKPIRPRGYGSESEPRYGIEP